MGKSGTTFAAFFVSDRPQPKGRKVDSMMTFKDLKKLVELPLYKEQRVPTVKALEVSGVPVVAEKILENHGSMRMEKKGEC